MNASSSPLWPFDDERAGRSKSAVGSRLLALAGVALLLGTTLQVMYSFITVVGVPVDFFAIIAGSLVAATLTARFVRPAIAVTLGTVMLCAGLAWYLLTLTGDPKPFELLADALSLFAGETLLRITNIHVWVLGVAPGPVFVTWYFAMRRQYSLAVLAAGATLGFFVLTGDADVITTVTGVVGGTAAVGFGDLEQRGIGVARGETVVTVVAVMIVVPGVVSVVPASAGAGLPLAAELLDDGEATTLDATLTDVDERVTIQGPIELSPTVKFTVRSTEESYWRTASYDRYTGEGWVRTGGADPYEGGVLDGPNGRSLPVTQTVTAETAVGTVPAAWRPVSLDGLENVSVTDTGSFLPGDTLSAGQTYTVRSQVLSPSTEELQNAGRDYPEAIRRTYTQIPTTVPDRFHDRTSRLTANAETPYETALTVENWLRNNREYSLDVRKPRGDVATAFLFEMDRGYCTYYATTMVMMLRSEGIPARFVTGYSSGERVDEDRWVVRGSNSHAWVEAYFPDQGWVRFDPTPPGPRIATSQDRLENARANDTANVDTAETEPANRTTSEPTPTPEPLLPPNATDGENRTTPTGPGESGDDQSGNGTTLPGAPTDPGGGFVLPTRHQLGLGLLALVGLVVGLRRTAFAERLYRSIWVRYQPRRGAPDAQIERAYRRLAYHLERKAGRARRPGETVREWFTAISADADAYRVMELRERARYAGEATQTNADRAVSTVDRIVR